MKSASVPANVMAGLTMGGKMLQAVGAESNPKIQKS